MAAKAPQIPKGLQWPVTDEKGERSSTLTGQAVWSAAFGAVDAKLAEQAKNEKKWRFKYTDYILKHVERSLNTPESALDQARAGLAALYANFEIVRDGQATNFGVAMSSLGKAGFAATGFIRGTKPKPTTPVFEVPYKGGKLSGEALLKQLMKWKEYGTIEKGTADAIAEVVKNPQWSDLSDQTFVLLGAGSAMGPYSILMALGANVIAVDLDRKGIWDRLISIAKDSPGTLTFALKKPQGELKTDAEIAENAGCDLLSSTPEILNWLLGLEQIKSGKFTVGCYVYLDGEMHVRVALACDAIMKGLYESVPKSSRANVALAYLCTPTDAHVINPEAHQAAKHQFNNFDIKNALVAPLRLAFPRWLVKNASPPVEAKNGEKFYYVDGLVVAQGPNYALAKRLQHWRAIVARDEGCTVSSNVAPSTATVSVVHNKQFAWAYDGMPYFKPYEIFQGETSNSVMSALLIHDLRNKQSVANPSIPLRNPLELFSYNSFHGGVWRAAYKVGTIGETSVIIHFVKVGKFFLLALLFFILYMIFRK